MAREQSAEALAEQEVAASQASVVAPVAPSAIKVEDEAAFKAKAKRMGDILRAQPKRRVRISKELWGNETFVGINGYKFVIQNGIPVEVPEQVAQLLEDMGRI